VVPFKKERSLPQCTELRSTKGTTGEGTAKLKRGGDYCMSLNHSMDQFSISQKIILCMIILGWSVSCERRGVVKEEGGSERDFYL